MPTTVETMLEKLKSGMKKRKNAARAASRPRRAIFAGEMNMNTSSNARLVSEPIVEA